LGARPQDAERSVRALRVTSCRPTCLDVSTFARRRCPRCGSTHLGPRSGVTNARARHRGPGIEAHFACRDCGEPLSLFQVVAAQLGAAFGITDSIDPGFFVDSTDVDPISVYWSWKRRAGVGCPISLEFTKPENIQTLTCRTMKAALRAKCLAAVGDAEAAARELENVGAALAMLCMFAEWADSIAALPPQARAADQSSYSLAIRTIPALLQALCEDVDGEAQREQDGEARHDG